MVRRFVIDLTNLHQFDQSVRQINQINSQRVLHDIGEEIRRKFLVPLVVRLRRYPSNSIRRRRPLEFVSPKQRRFVMALLNGRPYRRTRRMARGWRPSVRVRGGVLYAGITNTVPYTGYVMGKYGAGTSSRQIRRYRQPQQPYHRRGGWGLAYKEVTPVYEQMRQYAQVQIKGWVYGTR